MSESSAPSEPAPSQAELHVRPIAGTTPSVYRMHVELAGLYVETEEDLPEGAIVSVQVSLPRQRKELKTVARVSYRLDAGQAEALSRKPGVGLQLLDVWGRDASDPVEDALEGGSQPDSDEERALGLRGARVLIIDDDDNYRQLASQGMREAGCEVLTASNGVEGLSTALRETPDLIVSDVTMPGLDGWQLLRLLRTKASLRNTPVIFLTELKDESDRLRGYRLGVDDYVPKPFTTEELTVRAQRAVERAAAAAGGLRGELGEIPLGTLLSLAELERKSGVIELAREGERARLEIRDGQVRRIELGPRFNHLLGIERFFHLLDWPGGRFEFIACTVDTPDELELRTSFVLLEHARNHDER